MYPGLAASGVPSGEKKTANSARPERMSGVNPQRASVCDCVAASTCSGCRGPYKAISCGTTRCQ